MISHYKIHTYEDINEYYLDCACEILCDIMLPLLLDYDQRWEEFDADVKAWVKAGKPDNWNFI